MMMHDSPFGPNYWFACTLLQGDAPDNCGSADLRF